MAGAGAGCGVICSIWGGCCEDEEAMVVSLELCVCVFSSIGRLGVWKLVMFKRIVGIFPLVGRARDWLINE